MLTGRAKVIAAVVALLGIVAFIGIPSTTSAGAATFTYGASVVAPVDVRHVNTPDATEIKGTAAREWSASPSPAAWGTSTTFLTRSVATEAAGAGDALVLGKYPDYIKLADELGARRFSIPDAEWNALTREARWAANQAVLDQAITDRIPIVLSNPATPEFLTGTYGDEIAYLIKQGYEIGPNAMSMVPKGG